MKRLLTTTTAFAVALGSVPPLPVLAQTVDEAGRVIGADGSVLCDPAEAGECDLGAIMKRLADEAAAAEVQRAAEEAAAAEAQRAAEEAAAAAAAEQAAQEAAAAEAQRAAEEAQRAAEEAAAAEAQRAAEEAAAAAAAEQAAQEAAAAEAQRAAEEAQRAAEEAAAAEAQRAAEEAAAAAAAEQAAQEAAAAEAQRAAEEAAAAAIAAQQAAEAAAAGATAVQDAGTPEPAVTPEATAAPEVAETLPAELPEPTPEAVDTLETLLVAPEPAAGAGNAGAEAPPPAAAALLPLDATPADVTAPPAADAVATTVQEITEADTRSSFEEFAPAAAAGATATEAEKAKRRKDKGLTDLEKVGLVALGALVVGAILKNGDRVERNTGDRVVVQREDGSYVILKDDDTLLRRPGSTIRTETFRDGSTRTIVERADGSRVVTIRDASGRVLRRVAIDARGRETLLLDDLVPVEPIDVATLPRPRKPVTISASGQDAALAAAMAAIAAREVGRGFTLRQIREIREVRALAPVIDVEPITFRTGSAAIDVTEAQKLADLGRLITQMIAARPNELFLIEGHTDAVGSAASNLTLSDRRAESVALALTEYFGVRPENLIVQGYGETDLLIPTEADEPRNRRVAVRLITPLLAASR